MSSSDETTTTGRHEPMVMERFTLLPGGGRGDYREETVCVSCWVGCDDETCIEPHGNAPWPCENARLRERVALLEGAEERADASDSLVLALTDALADAVLLIHETRHDGLPAVCAERVCEIGKQLVQAARDSVVDNLAAALAQVDGRA